MTTTMTPTPDYTAIKTKQNAAWASGDYAKIGVTLQIVGEQLAEGMDLAPDTKVLDVAAGNGNATLAFARRWCQVTSTDYVDSLLAAGRERSRAEGLNVRYQIADAEDLPFEDASFDAVVSTFGAMFAPDQDQVAAELLRVCRPGGSIGMANWTPDGFIGQMFKTLGKHIAPPAGVASPARWGDQEWLEDSFAGKASAVTATKRDFMFRYRTPDHFVQFFRTYYGPIHKAFLALDEDGQRALERDLHATVAAFNTATDGTMRVPSTYAEVVITRA
ncbi:MAG: class I SAM-dependent methyltransferase [Pseudomonadota bacterium]